MTSFCLQTYPDHILLGRLSPSRFQENYFEFCRIIQESFLQNRLLHISLSPDEVSIFYDKTLWSEEKHTAFQIYGSFYRALQLHCFDNGINHVGIVSRISQVLSSQDISMLYINTYNHNFVLVQQEDYEKTIQVLKEEGLISHEDD